ncbi:hypothetical protein DN824_20600 [Stutzerimonas nosocomialis]|uniref:Uncharacterized protein n=1 Tax=Stutzerimonas nosocomialis TaxID=1056496 RepID=A0A5R9QER9_9GAMM|nr:hypothetical protein [Stutzerimonas nosocomialis]TLX54830.1 hypothetical protein DN824_20600 [Stutzerimonas nosocomialis]TLX58616.1 hypothetical protein DN826_04870 [Stutzerimonas nosocomialis]TLX63637.1 hypothetical protein DN820_09625 [Stutzerimonas nosocomialis]
MRYGKTLAAATAGLALLSSDSGSLSMDSGERLVMREPGEGVPSIQVSARHTTPVQLLPRQPTRYIF